MKLQEEFTKQRDRSIDVYYTSEEPLAREGTHIKLSLYYALGGANYFTGQQDPRGFNVSVSVVTREDKGAYSSESQMLGEGYRMQLEPAKRFNAKKLSELLEKAKQCGLDIVERNQTKYFAPPHRPLREIAGEIHRDWKNVYFGAVPYLNAMAQLSSIEEDFHADSARSVVAYFLSNAQTWRGETAKRIKAELKSLI